MKSLRKTSDKQMTWKISDKKTLQQIHMTYSKGNYLGILKKEIHHLMIDFYWKKETILQNDF